MEQAVLTGITAPAKTQITGRYQPTEIEQDVIKAIQQEKNQWESAAVFVTDKVAFMMQPLIRLLRKNYWGIFQDPYDSITNEEKIWYPLTAQMVKTVVANIDLDTKDIDFTAKNPEDYGAARVLRAIIKDALDRINEDGGSSFGEKLDALEADLAVDGTKVWKTLDKMSKKDKRRTLNILEPDLLNIFIDPSADNIQDAYRFTERARLLVAQLKAMKSNDWINTEYVTGGAGLPFTDPSISAPMAGIGNAGSKYVDVYELWGKGPTWWITGRTEDKEADAVEIDIHAAISGLEKPGQAIVHLVETYDGMKPYEEAWYTKIPGRWYGKGIAEEVMWLQLWVNIIVNIRITRSKISQLGIWKIKRGAGITPQMITNMAPNGAIVVNNMEDIEQMVMEEASQSSYTDETNIVNLARSVTNAFQAVTGEAMPASTPATNAVLSTNAAKSGFTMVKEQIGMFLKRFLRRHALPVIMENVNQGDIIRLTGELADLQVWDNMCANWILVQKVEEANKNGIRLNPQQVLAEKQRIIQEWQHQGKNRYTELVKMIDVTLYDIDILITNEEIDTNVIANNLLSALKIAPQYQDQIMKQLFDIMGLNFQPISNAQMQNNASAGQGNAPAGGAPALPLGTPVPAPASAMPATANPAQPVISAVT